MVLSGKHLPFTHAEYCELIAKMRRAMQDRGIELLIAKDPSNVARLTGSDRLSAPIIACCWYLSTIRLVRPAANSI